MGRKSRYWDVGTTLKCDLYGWVTIISDHFSVAAMSFYKVREYYPKEDGRYREYNIDYDFVEKCMEEVTEAEKILYGKCNQTKT